MSQFLKIRRHYIAIESPDFFLGNTENPAPRDLGLKCPVRYSLLFPLPLGTREKQSSLHFMAAADLLFPNSREIFLCTPVPIQSEKQTRGQEGQVFWFSAPDLLPSFHDSLASAGGWFHDTCWSRWEAVGTAFQRHTGWDKPVCHLILFVLE